MLGRNSLARCKDDAPRFEVYHDLKVTLLENPRLTLFTFTFNTISFLGVRADLGCLRNLAQMILRDCFLINKVGLSTQCRGRQFEQQFKNAFQTCSKSCQTPAIEIDAAQVL